MINLVYFGTPPFARDVLAGILADPEISVKLVVTGAKKTRGRHGSVPTAVSEFATANKLTLIETDSPRDPVLADQIRALNVDLGVIVAWRILPEAVFSSPRLGTVNLHGSLLPKYRGAAPIQRAIWNGETETGLTVFHLNSGIDTGGILLQASFPISENDTTGDLFARFAQPGSELLRRAIHGLYNRQLQVVPQSSADASPAPKIKADDRWIDWSQSADCIRRHIHALSPDPTAISLLADTRVLFYRAAVDHDSHQLEPGTVSVDKTGIRIACGEGWLEILELAREGKRPMSGVEFARGASNWNLQRFMCH